MATGQDAELAFEGGVDVTQDAKDGRQQTILIRPSRGWVPLNLNDLWRYRELIYFLTWRDLKVRYRQTLIGATWGLLQPFLMMVVFSIFFARLAGVPSDGAPYPIFVYAALIPWTFFS